MKIYGAAPCNNHLGEGAADSYAVMNSHRANKNLQKAKDLGAKLATLTPSETDSGIRIDLSDDLPAKYLTQDILYQIKVLLVFAAETLLQSEIEDDLLSATAINAMHDKLRETAPGFFKNIADGAAFTFYCLALKKDGDLTENIGEAFAMLCSVQKNREGFIKAGKTVWNIALEEITKEIEAVEFKKI